MRKKEEVKMKKIKLLLAAGLVVSSLIGTTVGACQEFISPEYGYFKLDCDDCGCPKSSKSHNYVKTPIVGPNGRHAYRCTGCGDYN